MIKLTFVLVCLSFSLIEAAYGGVKIPAAAAVPETSGLLPNPTDLLPNVTNIFKQFADLMGNGLCGIDLEHLVTNDPDEKRSTCEIIEAKGFPCERHNVTTYGGYIIELHRIPAQGPQASNKTKKPVIVQAGLVGTSADFVIGSAAFDATNTSAMSGNLGLELAKRGYDVWLSNNRGGKYGMAHQTLSAKDAKFWKWTFEQMSEQDTTAIVDFVLAKAGADRLHYVGQSQGTALMWALLATNETINAKLASYVAISPITRLGNANTTGRAFINIFERLLELDGPIFTPNKVLDGAVSLACDAFGSRIACKLVLFSLTGPNCDELDESRLGVIMGHMPTSTSRRNLLHYKQLMDTDRFKRYDTNPLLPTAKDYPLDKISLQPILVIYGPNDWVVPLAGVEQLKKDLPGRTFYALSNPQANHIDPLVGKRSAPETNWQVARYIEQKD